MESLILNLTLAPIIAMPLPEGCVQTEGECFGEVLGAKITEEEEIPLPLLPFLHLLPENCMTEEKTGEEMQADEMDVKEPVISELPEMTFTENPQNTVEREPPVEFSPQEIEMPEDMPVKSGSVLREKADDEIVFSKQERSRTADDIQTMQKTADSFVIATKTLEKPSEPLKTEENTDEKSVLRTEDKEGIIPKEEGSKIQLLKKVSLEDEKAEYKPDEGKAQYNAEDAMLFIPQAEGSRAVENMSFENTAEFTEAVEQKIIKSAVFTEDDGHQEFEVQLEPEFLGKLTIKLARDEGGMKVSIATSNPQVDKKLTEISEVICQNIRSEGVQLNNVEIVYTGFLDGGGAAGRNSYNHRRSRNAPAPKGARNLEKAFGQGMPDMVNINGSVSYLV